MIRIFFNILKNLDPEVAHKLTINALKLPNPFIESSNDISILSNDINGLRFKNPIGMAAGFDKNAEVINSLFNLGFGFTECGTVTPRPQFGNAKPRVFRLASDKAIINRLGFNNNGIEKFLMNMSKSNKNGVLGANIGPNKDTENFIDDYINLYTQVVDYSDYVTVNVSSPNTENLREIQEHDTLNTLLSELSQLRENMKTQKKIILKIDPDSTKQHYSMVLNLVQKYKIDGIIATNTTISRPQDLMNEYKDEEGGISGQPLKELSNKVLSFLSKETNRELLLIGVGGISNAEDVYTKIKLGASLVQLYTALTFNGPQMINNIKKDLSLLLHNDGYENISDAVGIIHS